MPKFIDRAEGVAHARLAVGGTLEAPTWDGELKIEKGAFSFKQFAMPLVGVDGSIKIDPKTGVTIEKFARRDGRRHARRVTGGVALKGFDPRRRRASRRSCATCTSPTASPCR